MQTLRPGGARLTLFSLEILMKRFVVSSTVALTVALLAACSSTSDEAGAAAGAGAGSAATSTASYAPGSAAEFQAVVGDRVFFDFDSYALSPVAQDTLRKQAAWLKKYPERKLNVEGHADERGTREYNLALGERRANSVREFLLAQGVNGARLMTVSYGKERPTCTEAAEACWSQNRRGVSVVE